MHYPDYGFPASDFTEFIEDVQLRAEATGEEPNPRHLASIRRHLAVFEAEIAREVGSVPRHILTDIGPRLPAKRPIASAATEQPVEIKPTGTDGSSGRAD